MDYTRHTCIIILYNILYYIIQWSRELKYCQGQALFSTPFDAPTYWLFSGLNSMSFLLHSNGD